MVALFMIFIVLVFLTADYFVQRAAFRRASTMPVTESDAPVPVIPVPEGVFLDSSHTWARITGGGLLQLGVDGLVSNLLGEPDRIEMAPEGSRVKKGEPVVTVARGSRRLSLTSPVDGYIVQVNRETADQPWKLGSEPFGHSWIYEIKPDRLGPALKQMYVEDEAKVFAAGELRRLKETISFHLRQEPALGATALDGGTPRLGATACDGGTSIPMSASGLDDERWSRLVADFFSTGQGSIQAESKKI